MVLFFSALYILSEDVRKAAGKPYARQGRFTEQISYDVNLLSIKKLCTAVKAVQNVLTHKYAFCAKAMYRSPTGLIIQQSRFLPALQVRLQQAARQNRLR